LHVEMVVRQDLMQLYGFWTVEEKDLFKVLTSVQGVGMKVALSLLSVAEPHDLIQAIVSGDKALLNRAEGVGPKLASRLVNELKDKVGGLSNVIVLHPKEKTTLGSYVMNDAISVLKNLGYRQNEAEQAVNLTLQASKEDATVEEIIKLSLSKLSRI
ncbi:MAG: Holliday junction branch migration protein RuvA, partial [Caedimonadaceae bacterium]